MGRENYSKKYECSECLYGCKGHEVEFVGSTTINTGKIKLDGRNITPYLTYEDLKAIKEILNEWDK